MVNPDQLQSKEIMVTVATKDHRDHQDHLYDSTDA